MLRGELGSALSAKLGDGELKIVREFEFADHKTKSVAAALGKLEVKNTALLVEAAENENLTRGSRNLPGIKLVPTKSVTVYDLLKYKQVLLSEAAARRLSEALAYRRRKETYERIRHHSQASDHGKGPH